MFGGLVATAPNTSKKHLPSGREGKHSENHCKPKIMLRIFVFELFDLSNRLGHYMFGHLARNNYSPFTDIPFTYIHTSRGIYKMGP